MWIISKILMWQVTTKEKWPGILQRRKLVVCRAVFSGVSQCSVFGLILFNVSTGDPGLKNRDLIMNFVDSTKLGGIGNWEEDWCVSEVNWMENWKNITVQRVRSCMQGLITRESAIKLELVSGKWGSKKGMLCLLITEWYSPEKANILGMPQLRCSLERSLTRLKSGLLHNSVQNPWLPQTRNMTSNWCREVHPGPSVAWRGYQTGKA